MNADNSETAADVVIAAMRAWVDKAVIGLNLCPFAKAVQVKNQVRYVVSAAHTTETLRVDLIAELRNLNASDPDQLDTTLLIHPDVLRDFMDYNDFLTVADAVLEDLGFGGQIQIASFHPQYQFADTAVDDIDNYTNRSPYPVLHLLREASIERAVVAFPDAALIYQKNIATLRQLGRQGWLDLGLTDPD